MVNVDYVVFESNFEIRQKFQSFYLNLGKFIFKFERLSKQVIKPVTCCNASKRLNCLHTLMIDDTSGIFEC